MEQSYQKQNYPKEENTGCIFFLFFFLSALFFPCNLLVFSCILLKNYINSSVTRALSLAIFLNFIFLYPFFFCLFS